MLLKYSLYENASDAYMNMGFLLILFIFYLVYLYTYQCLNLFGAKPPSVNPFCIRRFCFLGALLKDELRFIMCTHRHAQTSNKPFSI